MFEFPIKRGTLWRLRPSARWDARPWQLPLGSFGDRVPTVLQRHEDDRHAVELGYESLPFDGELFVPVFAPQDGVVTLAGETPSGFCASIDHRPHGFATYIAHMSKTFLSPNHLERAKRRQWVRAGDVIGYASKRPIAIRFEVWKWSDAAGYVAVDPMAAMGELVPTTQREAA